MEVTQRLIEKYHLNLCSSEEKEAVEEWLMKEDFDTGFSTSDSKDKEILKEQMWEAISAALPVQQKKGTVLQLNAILHSTAFRTAAVLSGIALIMSMLIWKMNTKSGMNISEESPVAIVPSDLNITLGAKSRANIHSSEALNTNVDFCGIIRIAPVKDMTMTLKAICSAPGNSSEQVMLKKGHTYIAVNYRFKEAQEVIFVNAQNLSELPPLLQKEIVKQFNI